MIDTDMNLVHFISAFLVGCFAFIRGKVRTIVSNTISILILSTFGIYLFFFFMELNFYYQDMILHTINNFSVMLSLFFLNMSLFYLLTVVFYGGGLLLLLYELWWMDELPFEKDSEDIFKIEHRGEDDLKKIKKEVFK